MKTDSISKQGCIFASWFNVTCKLKPVKGCVAEIPLRMLAVVATALLVLGATAAQAADVNAQAIENSTRLLNMLSGVTPRATPTIVENIHNGSVKRIEPSYPVWILETENNSILYYQGQKAYAGQNATRLVDDNGFRFGQRALEQAASSRSTWLLLTLGGTQYRAYCASKAPHVVCSLIR